MSALFVPEIKNKGTDTILNALFWYFTRNIVGEKEKRERNTNNGRGRRFFRAGQRYRSAKDLPFVPFADEHYVQRLRQVNCGRLYDLVAETILLRTGYSCKHCARFFRSSSSANSNA